MVPFGELVSRDPQHAILIPSACSKSKGRSNLSLKAYYLYKIKTSRTILTGTLETNLFLKYWHISQKNHEGLQCCDIKQADQTDKGTNAP
jgi:hypothetical protein